MKTHPPTLVLEDVHAAYFQKEILRGLSLTIGAGEIVALLGENGSGKSTALKVIAGLLRPTSGTIHYQGRNLSDMGVPQRQQLGIGYLMQGGRIFPNLTVGENYDLAAAHARNRGKEPSRLGEYFSTLRIRCDDRAGLLSGGQRQMLAIEMVLAQKPALFLLDEPTAALSGELSIELLISIRRLSESTGASALLVEQNATTAFVASDRTLRLDQGTLNLNLHAK